MSMTSVFSVRIYWYDESVSWNKISIKKTNIRSSCSCTIRHKCRLFRWCDGKAYVDSDSGGVYAGRSRCQ